MMRPAEEIWQEILRTAELIRTYQPGLGEIAMRIAGDQASGKDARQLAEVASDAMILVALIDEFRRAQGGR
jgi:hypothetical protein